MASKQNDFSVQNLDYDATIKHYQDLNNQIEQKTHEVFESVTKLSNQTEMVVCFMNFNTFLTAAKRNCLN